MPCITLKKIDEDFYTHAAMDNDILKHLSPFGKILSRQTLAGGDINTLTWLHCEKGDLVFKSGNSLANMYHAEAEGLQLLKDVGLPTPEVIASGKTFLLMKMLEQGKKQPAQAGCLLAQAHLKKQNFFGLAKDNFIGRLPQKNIIIQNWVSFYRDYRLGFQLNLFREKNSLPPAQQKIWDNFFDKLETILAHNPQASLLHGDLWAGNLFWSNRGAVFIDPAVYCGDRYVDIAFSELFGNFGQDFYSAYHEVFPLGSEYRELKDFYQIYPLLVHANLFGGYYYNSAFSLMQKYVR